MLENRIFFDLIIILCTALFFGYLAKKVKQPVLTGYIVGGAVVSLFSGKWFNGSLSMLADVGVILLMFTLGVEFSFKRLVKIKQIVVTGTVLQIAIFSSILFLILSIFFKFSLFNSLFLALAFSLSSTAITVKLLFDRGETDTLHGEILTGWLLVQDLAVIPLWILLPSLSNIFLKVDVDLKSVVLSLIFNVVKTGVVLYLIFWMGKRIVPFILSKIAKTNTREMFLLVVVLMISVVGWGVSMIGLSPALGAFIAGLLISETNQHAEVFAETRPLRDILSIIFFVSLGLLFNAGFLYFHFSQILSITLIILVTKFLVVLLLMGRFGFHSKISFLTAFGLCNVGEFAFVLGRFGLQNSLLDEYSYQILLSSSVLSMVISPWIISSQGHFFTRINRFLKDHFKPLYKKIFASHDIEIDLNESLGYESHVVICGHGRVGSHISKILDNAKIPYVVIDFNHKIIAELKNRAVNVIYGDPTEVDVLSYAKIDKAKVLVVAVPDHHSQEMIIRNSLSLNPKIIIVCRSHHEEDVSRLYSLGVHSIIKPEFEAALHMSGVLLKIYKLNHNDIMSFLNDERKNVL